MAVCLLFDARSERAVRRLWDRLEEGGVPTLRSHTHGRHVPHLSYAVLREWCLDDVRSAVEQVPDGGPVELSFDGVGTFPRGRTWLIPAMDANVVARQARIAEALVATGAQLHHNYLPGAWIPHCTLAPRVQLAALPKIAAAVNDVVPLKVRADRAALIDSGTGERWPLGHIP
nr:2'-5' RNA ligase family protein [Phytoactinopolyspora alkaliphila]